MTKRRLSWAAYRTDAKLRLTHNCSRCLDIRKFNGRLMKIRHVIGVNKQKASYIGYLNIHPFKIYSAQLKNAEFVQTIRVLRFNFNRIV